MYGACTRSAGPCAPSLSGAAGVTDARALPVQVPLPMVNWVPLRNVAGTVFESLTDEQVLEELDFTEFEAQFKAKQSKDPLLKIQGRKKKKETITVMETNRAKNLVITARRIGMEHDFLKETILATDLTELLPEHAELLLNFIPTEEEISNLEKHSHHKDRLDEAERFMFEMLKVERYESRLRIIAYIGFFDEILLTALPQVEAVISACDGLLGSKSFHKLLEIILAFGNYMNSAKRGSAFGTLYMRITLVPNSRILNPSTCTTICVLIGPSTC
eukprot:m.172640 g.172640  ORF g.172640 m.172640 type:complete len:274 (-) comp18289_c0_seq8:894-1715(-)